MPDPTKPASLLIEGWRGVNQSCALLNQHMILELLKLSRLRLFHRDLPFAEAHWNPTDNAPGFSAADNQRIGALAEPGDAAVDCVYRVCSPARPAPIEDHRRTLTFVASDLVYEADRADAYTRKGDLVVTTNSWSRDRIVERGVDPGAVKIVPAGVDAAVFAPFSPEERSAGRALFGFAPDETVFLCIGAATWSKGTDLLLLAFARLRERGRRARLILKDRNDVHGPSVERMLQEVGLGYPSLLSDETLSAISVVSENLDLDRLRLLYGLADVYVSPYRVHGFNLPVLEAIACGTPVIVTRGGPTDDYCDDDVACRVPGRAARRESGAYIEPDSDALLAAMDGFCVGPALDRARFGHGRARIVAAFSWARAARALAGLVLGRSVPAPAVSTTQVQQRDILGLLDMIRPWDMARNAKVRVGNSHDGGYVLPSRALQCDVALSIGIGHDVSFDFGLAEQGARVLQFDHTVAGPPVKHPQCTFERFGWGVRSEGCMLGFPEIHARVAALSARRALLKFDIEGAEYEVLDAIDPDQLAEYEVIACELHGLCGLADPHFFFRVHRALARLTLQHVPVHLHANNYGTLALVEGIPMPDTLEVSLLRHDLDSFPSLSRESIPGPHDAPNNRLVPDICLNAF